MKIEVSLPDDLTDFIERRVASGQYASASAVVTEALSLLVSEQAVAGQTDAEKLEWLREAVRLGEESGDAGEIDIEDIIAEGRARLAARVK